MTTVTQVALTSELLRLAATHISTAMRNTPGIDSAALCALNGQVLWASNPAFERIAPRIAQIGLMSLKLWVKVRTGKLDRIGLVTDDGTVDLIFVGRLASVLVISGKDAQSGWLEDEPAALLAALDL